LYGVDGHFPALDPPALPDMGTGIYTKSAPLTIGPENSGKYTSMDVLLGNEPGVLEIDGGEVVLHVTGDITLGNSCELIIKEGSSLVIYVEGDLVAGNESSVTNESKEPKNLRLYGIGEDQDIDLKAKNEWSGAVYAPDADVSIKAGADVYGSFISTNFENMNGNFVYYDAALRDVSTTDVGACFVVDRWEEE
jgi:choice-of-anchor A domain-containing protein